MPLFFFHLHEGADVPDREGRMLPSLDSAVAYAVGEARCLVAADIVASGRFHTWHRIDITDDRGVLLHSVLFGDVVTLMTDSEPQPGASPHARAAARGQKLRVP